MPHCCSWFQVISLKYVHAKWLLNVFSKSSHHINTTNTFKLIFIWLGSNPPFLFKKRNIRTANKTVLQWFKLGKIGIFSIYLRPNQILYECFLKWLKTKKEEIKIIKGNIQNKYFNMICPPKRCILLSNSVKSKGLKYLV